MKQKKFPIKMQVTSVLFLVLGAFNSYAAPLRGHRGSATTFSLLDNNHDLFPTLQSHRTNARTTRYPFHFDRKEQEQQRPSLIETDEEPAAATPPTADTSPTAPVAEDDTAAATGAKGGAAASGTTGSTGATGGATSGTGTTGGTGSTGATGMAATAMGPLEEESEEDYIVTAEMDCPGINVEQVNMNMDAIVGAVSGILRSVAQDKVEITAVDNGAAPSAEVNARRRRLLNAVTAPAGVRLTLVVRGVSEDAGKTAAYNLLNSQTGASHPTLIEALQGAGLQTLTAVSFTEGKSPKSRSKWELGPEGAGCTGKIELELSAMEDNGKNLSKL